VRGLRLALGGHSFKDYVRRAAVPGIIAESALLPLAVVIVFLYQPGEPIRIGVLGAMFLMFNFGFNRIYATSAALRLRVSELEVLGVTSRKLTHSLQSSELVQTVAKETLSAIPCASRLSLSWSRSVGQRETAEPELPWTTVVFNRGDAGHHVPRDEGDAEARSWVRVNRAPLLISDRSDPETGVRLGTGTDARAWLGVPLEIHDEVLGVLAIESDRPNMFGGHELRLLRAIGTQAGVALQNARLYELAMVDGLTKLFVRRYFAARLEEEVHRSLRFGTDFSVVMMDIDNFKSLNDTYGHQVGDQLLAGFADVVRRQLRAVDTAARYGGEEFAIILPRTSLVDALTMAERIRAAVSEFSVTVDGRRVGTTASFGIAAFPESGGVSGEDVVHLADQALYRAKDSGKDRVELSWPPAHHRKATERGAG
jgi:diguanylate cyclase (GGDEF)-like protein